MSGEPPRKKTKLEPDLKKKSSLKNPTRAAAREDFDPPFPPEEEDDARDDRTSQEEDEQYEPDPDPEGNLEIAPGTRANTRLNTGYTSVFGQQIARAILIDLRGRSGLRIIALAGQQEQGIPTNITNTTTATIQQAVATHAQEQQRQHSRSSSSSSSSSSITDEYTPEESLDLEE